MKFDIKKYLTGNFFFSAEIECADDADTSIKIGLSLRWALKNRQSIEGADLRRADLQGADLRRADLQGAYLQGADLQGAYLQGAYLQGAYLQGADLRRADLQGAYLQGADLQGADLQDVPIFFGPVGKEKRTGVAMYDKETDAVMVRLGCFYGTETAALDAIAMKYGPSSGYAALVTSACVVAADYRRTYAES